MKRQYSFLNDNKNKIDLKNLKKDDAEKLAEEIRSFLVESVEISGGHLASNLGVVELTLALHKVFDTPNDRIIWDVGHQSYVHKILTGRASEFNTLRTPGGLSGFTKRSESEHDAYGTGHSSTSISAAIGFAEADRLQKRSNYTVAVLGDGAFTGGLVHEALNNINKDLRLIIILNENEMSISKNIGSFSRLIAKMRATRGYLKTKSLTRTIVTHIPLIGKGLFRGIRHIKKSIKNAMYGSNYFEDLGLYYLGPADGNNFEEVENLLHEAVASGQSTVIHLKTTKGKGYAPAEEKPNEYHSVAPQGSVAKTNFSSAMGETITKLAENDDKIVAITAAMEDGCGLSPFAKAYPDRFFDVGIAEEHALIFAAGLSLGGMKPIVPIYSSFLQRGYDSILHDIALQHVPVVVPIDRASLAASDGPTHHGIYDVSFLSGIPDVTLYAPATYASLEAYIKKGLVNDQATFIRYPNSDEFLPEGYTKKNNLYYNNVENPSGIIITYGSIIKEAERAAKILADQGFACGIILLEQLKPLETDAILSLLPKDLPIVFLEEGARIGGVGVTLYDAIRNDISMKDRAYTTLAIDSFAEGVAGESLYKTCGISAEDVVKAFVSQK